MKNYEKETLKNSLEAEQKELKRLQAIYKKAVQDASNKIRLHNGKISVLLSQFDELDEQQKSILQSQIYQKQFQENLKRQLDDILKDLQNKQHKSISEYLKGAYEDGFTSAMYSLHKQGIPIVLPIDQKQVVRAMTIDSKISKGLYSRLGEDVARLKQRIANNISRGVATADTYANIARNIANGSKIGFNNAMRITRTEGNRIANQAKFDASAKAKETGADVLKQWSAALDGKTRPHHRQLDGQIRELEDPFEVAGLEAMHPSDFGRPEEDINCRCTMNQRARWALDDDELETLKERAEYFGLDKTEDFDNFKKKYLKAVETSAKSSMIKSIDIDDMEILAYGKDISKDVVQIIHDVIKPYERKGDFYISEVFIGSIPKNSDGGTPALQIETLSHGLLQLKINSDVFAGRTKVEIDEAFAKTKSVVANSLEEAVEHECGHAELISGMSISQVEALYSELADIHIEGISAIAYDDGAECIAEVRVLLKRGEEVPEEALKLYNKYIGKK